MEKRFGSSRTRRDVNQLIEAQTNLNAHADATSGVHGLGSGVYLVGCKQGTRRIETKTGSTAVTGKNGNVAWSITITFDNAFASSVVCLAMPAPGSSSGVRYAHCGVSSLSTTGATGTFLVWLASGSYTSVAAFIAVGT